MTIKPATPLPWRTEKCRCGSPVCSSGLVEPFVVKYQGACEMANAAYIVHACNAYPELVAALRSLIKDADQTCKDEGWPALDASDTARALLAKLGEDK